MNINEVEEKNVEFVLGVANERPIIPLYEHHITKAGSFAYNIGRSLKNDIKKKDTHISKRDGRKVGTRFTTGPLAEIILEEWIGKPFIDWTIGRAKDYSKPDLHPLGINAGVKGVEWLEKKSSGKCFAVTRYKPRWYEVFVIIGRASEDRPKDVKAVGIILGIGSPEIIENYRSDDLVYDKRMLDRKTAFWNLPGLIPIDAKLKGPEAEDELKRIAGKWQNEQAIHHI